MYKLEVPIDEEANEEEVANRPSHIIFRYETLDVDPDGFIQHEDKAILEAVKSQHSWSTEITGDSEPEPEPEPVDTAVADSTDTAPSSPAPRRGTPRGTGSQEQPTTDTPPPTAEAAPSDASTAPTE